MSSPSGVELVGDLDSASAASTDAFSAPTSDFGAGLVGICTNLTENMSILTENDAKMKPDDPPWTHQGHKNEATFNCQVEGSNLTVEIGHQGCQKGSNLEPRGPILEPTGARFVENCVDLQALICSAPEFVQFADLGYPASYLRLSPLLTLFLLLHLNYLS